MRRYILVHIVLIFLTLSGYAQSATHTWNGSTNADWNVPSNWTPASVPNDASIVKLPSASPFYPHLGTSVYKAKEIRIESGAQLNVGSGATLTSEKIENIGMLTIASGATAVTLSKIDNKSGGIFNSASNIVLKESIINAGSFNIQSSATLNWLML